MINDFGVPGHHASPDFKFQISDGRLENAQSTDPRSALCFAHCSLLHWRRAL
jgi:hypothetical protein